ncbi:hypothetical protein N5P37_011828, partial [Trichoderma harzianum]
MITQPHCALNGGCAGGHTFRNTRRLDIIDGISAASSVIAVADLSAKVVALCSQYSKAVLNAGADVERLQSQVRHLDATLRHARHLIKGPNSRPLVASREAANSLQECKAELDRLQTRLKPDPKRKAMHRFGLRALKWPFSSQEIEAIVTRLESYQHTISLGLEHIKLRMTEDTSTARKAHFIVPLPKDADFVDRPVIWRSLLEQYAGSASRIALVGLGGIAIHFAHHIHAASPNTSVFCVHGSTRATFKESYQSIADTLALPRRHASAVNVLALVHDWLQRADVAPWLMVLDNADDTDVFFGKNKCRKNMQSPIASYLPKTENGKVLVTSRSLTAAEKSTGSHRAIIKIPTIDSSEALELFRKKLNERFDEDGAVDLIEALDFVPLAVNQAAAYINRRAPRVSVYSYLEDFRGSEKQKGSLLNSNFGDLRRGESVSNSAIVTWQVTFEKIRQERPTAAKLLSLMSLFQAQNIPEYMLHGYSDGALDKGADNADDAEAFEEDFDVLRAYSLIDLTATTGVWGMHSLVQFCTKAWLLSSGELMRWKRLLLRLASRHFPSGAFETWATCQILLPLVQPVLDEKPTDETDILAWSQLLTNTS